MYCDCPILGRCCFCIPLRKGILIFGYMDLVSSALMIAILLYSYLTHKKVYMLTMYHGVSFSIPEEICIGIYCIEFIFNIILIYGSHTKQMLYIRVYYYFALMTVVASILVQIIEMCVMTESSIVPMYLKIVPLMFASFCIEIYLIVLVRSLLRKMDISSRPNVYDNPLQQIVYEGRTSHNGSVYEPTVEPVNI